MDNNKVLDISWGTILKIAIASLAFYILFLIRDVLVWVIFALIISVLFNPAINFLQRKGFPRGLSVILVYVFIFGILGLAIYTTAPIFVSEIQEFSKFFPTYFEKISPPLKGLGIEAFESFEKFTGSIEGWLIGASDNIFSALGAIFGGIFSTVTIFAIALFISLEEKGAERVVALFTPKKYEAFVLTLWEKSQRKVSGWFGARILSSIFVGLMTFVVCYVLKVEYAISFAFFAGITNFIPIIGPVAAGLLIVLFTALDSWVKALFFLLAFIIIQQIEGNILTPVLTRRFVGLPPALVLIALIVGAKLWGILGAVLAIPLAGILFEFLRDFLKKRKEEEAVIV
jgi:predicted PurR-regulated permease PerM